MKVQKLTPALLKKIILEEKSKMQQVEADGFADTLEDPLDQYSAAKVGQETGGLPDGKMKDVEADGYSDTLEKEIDYYSALKVRENRLREALKRVTEAKRRVAEKIKKG